MGNFIKNGLNMKETIIIGAGITGLTLAYKLLQEGHKVVIFEKEEEVGGIAQSFSFSNGFTVDRFYHFICKGDKEYLPLLDELGLGNKVQWVKTKMGYYYDGKLLNFGTINTLFSFPNLTTHDKLKYAFFCSLFKDKGRMEGSGRYFCERVVTEASRREDISHFMG